MRVESTVLRLRRMLVKPFLKAPILGMAANLTLTRACPILPVAPMLVFLTMQMQVLALVVSSGLMAASQAKSAPQIFTVSDTSHAAMTPPVLAL
tara:strand:+ start:2001 stop:2282 length:282 start_codon:yes stop_codon:yes gene_type:complete